jgi:hypothetical protein
VGWRIGGRERPSRGEGGDASRAEGSLEVVVVIFEVGRWGGRGRMGSIGQNLMLMLYGRNSAGKVRRAKINSTTIL